MASWSWMPTEHLIPAELRALYHVREWRNAAGVLSTACPDEWADILAVLHAFRLRRSEILTAGGGLSPISQQVNGAFDQLGKGASYGNSTTHHEKLWPRLEGGGGGGCPVLTFAITPKLYVDDGPEALAAALRAKTERNVKKPPRRRKDGVSPIAGSDPDIEGAWRYRVTRPESGGVPRPNYVHKSSMSARRSLPPDCPMPSSPDACLAQTAQCAVPGCIPQ